MFEDFFEDESEIEEDTQQNKYLTFLIDNESFAIELKHISEIVGMQEITKVPQAPVYADGIINLRGKIIPVVNVRMRFAKETVAYDKRTCIIIVNAHEMNVGLIVDGVDEVIEILDEDTTAPPKISTGEQNRFIKAIARVDDCVKLLLDCDKVLSEDEFLQIKQNI